VENNFQLNGYKEYLYKIMKDERKNWPRDKKGRWIKKNEKQK